MAPPTLVEPGSGAGGHIPAVAPNGTGSLACELCHSASGFTTFSGTTMYHAYVTSMKCDSCHEHGMTWKTNAGLWTRPSTSHHAGQDCGGSGCHTSCDTASRCGGGGNAAHLARAATPGANSGGARPAGHIATSDACLSCHTTAAWLPVARVDHSQVSGSCLSCHDGRIALGKRASHIATAAACESCHTTIAWTPARFDHAALGAHGCTGCHNSLRAAGVPRAHVPTQASCDNCHGTLAWRPAKVDHGALTAGCASCHNNAGALGLTPAHLRTGLDCARCHSYPDWSLVRFQHTSGAYPGGRHAKLACSSCHTTNTEQVAYSYPADAGRCGGCHAQDPKPAAHPHRASDAPLAR
ncbi:MAG: hypothetical protein JO184_13765 [Gammaproteobacteria bacterium]|nr:hypothetical protein [Gammaproteobacteria bacterium]